MARVLEAVFVLAGLVLFWFIMGFGLDLLDASPPIVRELVMFVGGAILGRRYWPPRAA